MGIARGVLRQKQLILSCSDTTCNQRKRVVGVKDRTQGDSPAQPKGKFMNLTNKEVPNKKFPIAEKKRVPKFLPRYYEQGIKISLFVNN